MHHLSKLGLSVSAALLLSACDPAFETTAQKCAEGQEVEIVIPIADPKYQVLVSEVSTDSGYKLYLKQALEVMEPAAALTDPDEIAARDFVNSEIDRYLSYQSSAGEVTGATNPLDFLEALIATTDENLEIEAFVLARNQVATGIADDNDFCSYTNDDIRLIDTDADATTLGFAEMSISYNPFTRIVQQSVIVAEQRSDLDTSETRATVPYVGFFQALPENYTNIGFTEPEVRQAIVNDESGIASLSFDEGKDTQLGQLLLDYNNEYCDSDREGTDPAAWEDCPTGTTTRTPSTAVGGVCDSEANKVKENTFDLNPSATGLKRLRVEVDYFDDPSIGDDAVGQIRYYVSTYQEAIFAADGMTVIEDPTDCEKQAVLDELFEAGDGGGVRLTFVPDTGYDITYQTDADGEPILDSDGNQIVAAEPIPLFTYQGTASAINP